MKTKRYSLKTKAMKTLLTLLLFPLLILAQPNYPSDAEFFKVHLSIGLEHETISGGEPLQGMVEILVMVEIFYKENVLKKESPAKYIPKHLNSLSLAGSYRYSNPTLKHQARLNNLLAVNDISHPTERSLTNWLKTVPYEKQMLTPVHAIPEGFGARVSL